MPSGRRENTKALRVLRLAIVMLWVHREPTVSCRVLVDRLDATSLTIKSSEGLRGAGERAGKGAAEGFNVSFLPCSDTSSKNNIACDD